MPKTLATTLDIFQRVLIDALTGQDTSTQQFECILELGNLIASASKVCFSIVAAFNSLFSMFIKTSSKMKPSCPILYHTCSPNPMFIYMSSNLTVRAYLLTL